MVLVYAVVCFIVIPLAAGVVTRIWLIRSRGAEWFEQRFLARFHPIAVMALLATLVMIFAFQADNITSRFFHVILIAVPILIQVYFNSSLVYGLMKIFRVPHSIAAPGALIGASNFFELAVATAIALYGPDSGAALATVVGVLVEVPVMLSVCAVCNRTRGWFDAASAAACPVPAPGCCAEWRALADSESPGASVPPATRVLAAGCAAELDGFLEAELGHAGGFGKRDFHVPGR
jgi:ACR3 family arsenite transporter